MGFLLEFIGWMIVAVVGFMAFAMLAGAGGHPDLRAVVAVIVDLGPFAFAGVVIAAFGSMATHLKVIRSHAEKQSRLLEKLVVGVEKTQQLPNG